MLSVVAATSVMIVRLDNDETQNPDAESSAAEKFAEETILDGTDGDTDSSNSKQFSFLVGYALELVFALFVFYLTLDLSFSIAFLFFGLLINDFAITISTLENSGIIAAVAFFGGYALQFIGHAIEKSMPVLVKHPIQATIAAPFFVIVEIFGLLRLRKELFHEINTLVDDYRIKEDQLEKNNIGN